MSSTKDSYYSWHLSLRVDRPVEVRSQHILALTERRNKRTIVTIISLFLSQFLLSVKMTDIMSILDVIMTSIVYVWYVLGSNGMTIEMLVSTGMCPEVACIHVWEEAR